MRYWVGKYLNWRRIEGIASSESLAFVRVISCYEMVRKLLLPEVDCQSYILTSSVLRHSAGLKTALLDPNTACTELVWYLALQILADLISFLDEYDPQMVPDLTHQTSKREEFKLS